MGEDVSVMQTAQRIAQKALFVSGGLVVVLGLIIWTGRADGLIVIHMGLGFVLLLSLFILAGVAANSGVAIVPVLLAVFWGVVVFFFGLVQEHVLEGDSHWVIQVLHVVISMGVIAWGRGLVVLIHRRDVAPESGGPPKRSEPANVS